MYLASCYLLEGTNVYQHLTQVKVAGNHLVSQSRSHPPKYLMQPTPLGFRLPHMAVLSILVLSISVCGRKLHMHKKRGICIHRVDVCEHHCLSSQVLPQLQKSLMHLHKTMLRCITICFWWDPHRHANPMSSAELGILAFSLCGAQQLKTWRLLVLSWSIQHQPSAVLPTAGRVMFFVAAAAHWNRYHLRINSAPCLHMADLTVCFSSLAVT